MSTADEIFPEVADENSPLHYGSVASASARRLDIGEFGQVEVDDGLQGFGGGSLAEGIWQGVSPGDVVCLQGE